MLIVIWKRKSGVERKRIFIFIRREATFFGYGIFHFSAGGVVSDGLIGLKNLKDPKL